MCNHCSQKRVQIKAEDGKMILLLANQLSSSSALSSLEKLLKGRSLRRNHSDHTDVKQRYSIVKSRNKCKEHWNSSSASLSFSAHSREVVWKWQSSSNLARLFHIYLGELIYTNLGTVLRKTKMYGDLFISKTLQESRQLTFLLSDRLYDKVRPIGL